MSAPPRTLTELFFDAVQAYGAHPAAFRHKADGAWRDVSHQEAAARVQALSLGLRELGRNCVRQGAAPECAGSG